MKPAARDRVVHCARWAAMVTVAALAVLIVLVAIRAPDLYRADQSAVGTVHATARALVPAARWVSAVGGPIGVDIGTGLVAVVLLCRRLLVPALAVVGARLLELGAETALKVVIGRPRPVLPDPVATASGLSFPSGHAAGAAVLGATVLILAAPRIARPSRLLRWIPAIALVVLVVLAIGASRVVLGVHNPSDVLGGFLLGIACATGATPLLLRVRAQPAQTSHISST